MTRSGAAQSETGWSRASGSRCRCPRQRALRSSLHLQLVKVFIYLFWLLRRGPGVVTACDVTNESCQPYAKRLLDRKTTKPGCRSGK